MSRYTVNIYVTQCHTIEVDANAKWEAENKAVKEYNSNPDKYCNYSEITDCEIED